FMNGGSFVAAASRANRLIIECPLSPQANAVADTTRSNTHATSERMARNSNRRLEAYNYSMAVVLGHTTIETQQGDISQARVDAVVNAANNHLWMGGGVAGALKRAGGIEIEREATAKGPIPIGEAVVTTGGALPAKYVIHAAAMGQDLATDRAKVS